jgi:putative CocE/NonD family hydrolase
MRTVRPHQARKDSVLTTIEQENDATSAPDAAAREVIVEIDVPCVLRDGVVLRADVYRPAVDVSLPALLTRHPYGKAAHTQDKNIFDPIRVARAGYVVIIQDVRGRYASDGEFGADLQEAADGYDSVLWAASLPGCNGDVGMFGRSYHAETQWAAARETPAPLRTIVPGMSPGHSMLDGFWMRGGAHELGCRLYWANRHNLDTLLRQSAGDQGRRGELLAEHVDWDARATSGAVYDLRPLKRYTEGSPGLTRQASASFACHADSDLSGIESQGTYDRITVPAFLMAGWYDIFLGSTLKQYAGMLSSAEAAGIRRPHLVIGPWSHTNNTGTIGSESYGLTGSAVFVAGDGDLAGQQIRWFDAILKGDDDALDHVDPVRVFVTGSNVWHGMAAYPPAETVSQPWYLHGDGSLSPTPPADSAPTEYRYDPADPVPTLGGPTLLPGRYGVGPLDQAVLGARSDIVAFESAELDEPLTLLGDVEVDLFAATDGPDTDFVARLIDVTPEGKRLLINDGIIRASARETFGENGAIERVPTSPVEPGKVYRYVIDLWGIGRTFLPGHRVRVEITSSCYPRWDPNLNTGLDPWESSESRVASQQVHHAPGTASAIRLPVYPTALLDD